jgi:hypothetical protein
MAAMSSLWDRRTEWGFYFVDDGFVGSAITGPPQRAGSAGDI